MFQIFKDNCRADPFYALKRLAFAFQALVFPYQCLKCRAYINIDKPERLSSCFCDNCLPLEPLVFSSPFCPVCGHLFDRISDPVSGMASVFASTSVGDLDAQKNHLCEGCLVSLPSVKRVRAAFQYQGIIKEAIPQFKYQSKLSLARVFETYMFDAFERFFSASSIDRILPIPLHQKKMKERGFNQSFLLIRNFKKKYLSIYGIKPVWQIDTGTLLRVKPTRPQTGFDVQQRKDNLKGAFCVGKGKTIVGENILLIDDVYTTGATCGEAAGVLLKSGANRVDALVLARA